MKCNEKAGPDQSQVKMVSIVSETSRENKPRIENPSVEQVYIEKMSCLYSLRCGCVEVRVSSFPKKTSCPGAPKQFVAISRIAMVAKPNRTVAPRRMSSSLTRKQARKSPTAKNTSHPDIDIAKSGDHVFTIGDPCHAACDQARSRVGGWPW